ncbi:sigma factor [Streptomyces sp. H27-C3]|uniref:sigma factor n=1 Tax=Streptomyces sp. H27-C3 TaxID=3046305 RepID=UPI0024BAE381|nr:sigma factor [Streptomyces sp. H27-C3]MDJ0461991.1 sigma factor [Streptomyces sp. H27-C3]
MIDLTEAQIAAAKDNDLAAVAAVVKATEERVQQLAWKYATGSGRTDQSLAEDLAQTGRIAVWEGLSRFNGHSVGEFFTFVDRTLKGSMSDERKVQMRQGVTRDRAANFERALSLANGDPYEAEFLVTTTEAMGKDRTLSPEMAYAARLSYQGLEYLDAPLGESETGESITLADTLAAESGIPVDLLEPSDYDRERRKKTGLKVRKVLSRLGEHQRVVLMGLTGILPVDFYGTERDDELSADHGIPRNQVRIVRSKGKDRFAELWLAAA